MGWFLTALAAAEASRELVSCAVEELGSLDLLFQNVSDRDLESRGMRSYH
jgi:hypothetical protein